MNLVCLIVALILFVLAALGVVIGSIALVPWGLAFLSASFIFSGSWPWPRRP